MPRSSRFAGRTLLGTYGAGPASLVMVVLTISACGGSSSPSELRAPSVHAAGGAATTRGSGVPAAAVAVIEGWANALRAGQPQRAASYWAHPSVMVNGTDASGQLTLIHIRDQQQAELADETLPCGATLRHTRRSGSYVEAEFTLGIRTGAGAAGSDCSGPASVDFLIAHEHIVRWLRAPVASGAPPGSPTPTVTAAPAQSV